MISTGDGGRELLLDGVPIDSKSWTFRAWAELARGDVLEVGLGWGINTRRLIERLLAREILSLTLIETSDEILEHGREIVRDLVATPGGALVRGTFRALVESGSLARDWDTILLDYPGGRADLDVAAWIAGDGAIIGIRGKA